MCIFTSPPKKVSKTRISAHVIDDGKAAFVVYENSVELNAGHPTAMILPVPNAAAGEVKMVDMTKAKKWFDKIDEEFWPRPRSKGLSDSSFIFGALMPLSASLPVYRVGDYQYSYAPNLQSLAKLQNNVFNVPVNIQQLLSQHYATGFGFLVCILDRDADFSPVAYTYPLAEGDSLFIPTRHEHGHGTGNTDPDWDHTIYLFGVKGNVGEAAQTSYWNAGHLDSAPVSMHKITFSGAIQVAVNFPTYYRLKVRKVEIHGDYHNSDLLFTVDVDKPSQQETISPLPPMPVGVCTATVTGRLHYIQRWYYCETCSGPADNIYGAHEGVCVACADKCHKGHILKGEHPSGFYCDCPYNWPGTCTFANQVHK